MQREKKKVKRFSKFMNNKMDYILFITVLILLSLGVVMVLSASAPSALSSTGKSYTYFLKQFEFALAGIGLMLFFSKSDYRFLKKYYNDENIRNNVEVIINSDIFNSVQEVIKELIDMKEQREQREQILRSIR